MRPILAGIVFVVVVFPCLVATSFLVGIRTWVLDRDFYQEVLDDPVLYETVVNELPQALTEDGFQRDVEATPEDRANAALGLAFGQVVTPDYLRTQVNDLIDEIFVFFENPDRVFDIDVDLVPVKEALAGPQGEDFARVLAENLPPCEAGQEPRAESGALPRCTTEGQTVAEVQESIMNSLPGFIESIPDRWTLEDNDEFNINTAGQSVPTAVNGALASLAFFGLVFWIGAAFLGGQNRKQIFLWLGLMMFIPGLMVLLTGLSIDRGIADEAIRNWNEGDFLINGEPASQEVREAIETTLIDAARRVADGFLIAGGMAAGIAFAFLALGIFFPQPQRKSTKSKRVNVPAQ